MRRKRRPIRSTEHRGRSASLSLRYVVIAAVLATGIAIVAVQGRWITDQSVPRSPSIQELLDDATDYIEQGNFAAAEKVLVSVLAHDADNGTAWLYRGQLARDRGNLDLALEAWRHVPNSPVKIGGTARFLEATVLIERKMARAGEQRLLKAIELNPTYLQPHEQLLALYVLQMRRADTLEQLNQIQTLRGLQLHEMVLRTSAGEKINDTDQTVEILQTFVAMDPDDTSSHVSLARCQNDAGRHEDAAKRLAEVLRRWPENEQVRGILIESLLALDRTAEAATLLTEHPPTGLSPSTFWQSTSKLSVAERDLRRAAQCLEYTTKLDSTHQNTHYQAGLLFRQIGQEDKAKTFLARAALLDRLRQQATLALRADRKRVDLLIPVLVGVGEILARLEQHADATNWYRLALSLAPKEERALAGLERAYLALQQSRANDVSQLVATVAPTESKRHPGTEPTVETPAPRNIKPSPAQTDAVHHRQIELRDVHQEVGMNFEFFNGQTEFKYLIEAMGGGVAALDFDSDGWPDLHFPQGCPLPVDANNRSHSDRLFRNIDGQRFKDVTQLADLVHHGYGQGCVAGDFDNDGFEDLVVANFGRNVIYRNNGDGTFTDVTEVAGFTNEKMSSSLALVDLDRDGDLDLYVVNYVDSLKVCRNIRGEYSTCRPESFNGEQDELYLNRGDGVFEEVTGAAGIVVADGKGLGVVTADLDGDNWPDIYVANDTTPNFLFQNRSRDAAGSPSQLHFVEKGLISGAAMSGEGRAEAGMGVACADFNGDANLDLFVTNYFNESNTAYFNQGDAFFVDVSREQGLAGPSLPLVGFGTQAIDLDLDGWPDLFVANGHIDDFGDKDQAWKMPPQLFHNLGGSRFAEVSKDAGKYFQGKYLGRGAARLDWNRDGRPDLVVVHQDAPAALLENETNRAGHFVVFDLHGVQSNRDAIGAKIHLSLGSRTQFFEVCGGDGFYSSNERRQVIGLGDATQIDRLRITWPSGQEDQWRDLPADCALLIVEGQMPSVRRLSGS